MINIVSKLFKISLFVLLAFGAIQAKAQSPKINLKATISPDSILIGDHVRLSLQATYDESCQLLALPKFDEKIADFIELVDTAKLDTLRREGNLLTIEQAYIITSFDSGRYVINIPMLLQTVMPDTLNVDTLLFPPVELYVNTIFVDTATYVMYDIKGVAEYPFVIWDYWWVGVIILGIALVLFALRWYLKWRKSRKGLFMLARPKDPPYIVALSELQKLRSEKLWEQDRTKQYYTRLTDIVRQYLEDTFGVQAMEKTSEEILQALANLKLDDKGLYNDLKELFTYSDLAKFAKYKPSPIENERSYQYAYDFVDKTKLQSLKQDESETKEINTQDDNNTKL